MGCFWRPDIKTAISHATITLRITPQYLSVSVKGLNVRAKTGRLGKFFGLILAQRIGQAARERVPQAPCLLRGGTVKSECALLLCDYKCQLQLKCLPS
jgi:hypothetical protein